jgi:hypothetical protein
MCVEKDFYTSCSQNFTLLSQFYKLGRNKTNHLQLTMKFTASVLALLAATVSADDSIADGSFIAVNICADGKEVKLECDFDILKDTFRRLEAIEATDEEIAGYLRRKLKTASSVDAFADLLNDCEAKYDDMELTIKLIANNKQLIEQGDLDIYRYGATAVLEEKIPDTIPETPVYEEKPIEYHSEGDVPATRRDLNSKSKDIAVDVVTADSIKADDSLFSITVGITAEGLCLDPADADETCSFDDFEVSGWGAC